MTHIIQWMVRTAWFRKASSLLAGFTTGLWVSANYWRQIRATLEVWGIERETWLRCLLLVMAAGLGGLSVSLTRANERRDK